MNELLIETEKKNNNTPSWARLLLQNQEQILEMRLELDKMRVEVSENTNVTVQLKNSVQPLVDDVVAKLIHSREQRERIIGVANTNDEVGRHLQIREQSLNRRETSLNNLVSSVTNVLVNNRVSQEQYESKENLYDQIDPGESFCVICQCHAKGGYVVKECGHVPFCSVECGNHYVDRGINPDRCPVCRVRSGFLRLIV